MTSSVKSIAPGSVEGSVPAPPSKSMTLRAYAAAFLSGQGSVVRAPSKCRDARDMLRALKTLGANYTGSDWTSSVHFATRQALRGQTICCGESGLALRMLSALAALESLPITLCAEGSLRYRPVGMVEAPLCNLGARCQTDGGLPPVTVHGPIMSGTVEVDGHESSQFVTGLLMGLPRCSGDSRLITKNLRSKPYIRMTLGLLVECGIDIQASKDLSEIIIPGGQRYKPIDHTVEGDWSGASFLLVAGAVSGNITVTGLAAESFQADRAILDALNAAGAAVSKNKEGLTVTAGRLRAFEFDATECPDLFPPLVALACATEGTSRIRGVNRLAHKESDRARALVEEFGAIGGKLSVDGDVLEVTGTRLAGGMACARNDHRIAMALAVAGLTSRQGVRIKDWQCVAKSYPDFFEVLDKLRASLIVN
jgi:3-phosphoshikimate 1-carboxyvinyltransferase